LLNKVAQYTTVNFPLANNRQTNMASGYINDEIIISALLIASSLCQKA